MVSLIQSTLPLSFSSSEGHFPDLIAWIKTIPASQLPQDYSSLAIFIHRTIPPVIKSNPPQVTQGDALPSAITKSREFSNLVAKLSSQALDPHFLPCLQSAEAPRAILVTKTAEEINAHIMALFFAGHIQSNTSALDLMCQLAVRVLSHIQEHNTGPFTILAHAETSVEPPFFPHFTAPAERSDLKISIQSVETFMLQSTPTLKPKGAILMERQFKHGEITKTVAHLSISSTDEEIIFKQCKREAPAEFTELAYEFDDSCLVGE